MPPPLIGGGIKRWYCLTSVCLSRTSGLSWEQRSLGRLKLAQVYPTSHVILAPLSRSKGQRSRSPGSFTHRGLNASGCCNGERGNVLGVGNYCYVAVCFGAHRGKREAGHIVSASAYSMLKFDLTPTDRFTTHWSKALVQTSAKYVASVPILLLLY